MKSLFVPAYHVQTLTHGMFLSAGSKRCSTYTTTAPCITASASQFCMVVLFWVHGGRVPWTQGFVLCSSRRLPEQTMDTSSPLVKHKTPSILTFYRRQTSFLSCVTRERLTPASD